MVKYTETIRRQQRMRLSAFDYFVGLALKALTFEINLGKNFVKGF